MNKLTIPNYTFQDTDNDNIKRFVDRTGNWTHYFIVDEKRYVPAVNHVLHCGFAKDARFHEYLLSVSKDEAKKKLETAGDEGSRCHQAIKDLVSGLKVRMDTKFVNSLNGLKTSLNNDEWDNLIGWTNWVEKYKPETISQDKAVYSKKYSYAGTFDWIGTILVPEGDKLFNPKLWNKRIMLLPDWKTSSGIYPEYASQVSAYSVATLEMGLYKDFFKQYKGRVFGAVLRIGTLHKCGFEFKILDRNDLKVAFDKFKCAYKIASDKLVFEPEIINLPMEFDVKIPLAKLN